MPQILNCSSHDWRGSKEEEREGRGSQGCRDGESKQRVKPAGTARGSAGRGSQEGYVEALPAEPVEDFGEESLLPGRQQLNGWSVRRWEQC